MYSVSNAYKQAMINPVQHHKVSGTIGSEAFTEDNILAGSLQILQQCSGNSEVQIGQVMVAELSATFRGINGINRGAWQGKEITVNFSQYIGAQYNPPWEDVPVGVYTISEAEWSLSGITVKAYDHMAKLDKRCSQRFVASKAFTMLTFACTQCGVELGNTQQEIEAMPNGQDLLTEYEDNDIETWRDFVAWIAQTLCGFAYAGRDGKIYIKQYTSTPIMTFTKDNWLQGASFSDFVTKYTGISVVNIKYGTTNYYGMPVDDGLTYNLGQNPFLQNYENGTERRGRILNALQAIQYTPFKLSMIGNIAFDLGDVLKFQEGTASETGVVCCITKMLYKHKQGMDFTGVGKNPNTASARSKTDKNISGLLSKVNSGEFRFEVIRPNTEEIVVNSGQTKRLSGSHDIRYTTGGNAQIHVNAEILLEASTSVFETGPVIVTVSYYNDGHEDTLRYPVETYENGKHILTLNYHIEAQQGNHTFGIYIHSSGGTVTIEPLALVTFLGTGIVVQEGFNGFLDVEDILGEIEMPEIGVDTEGVEDDPTIQMVQIYPDASATDTLGDISMGEIGIDLTNVTDTPSFLIEVESAQRITEVMDDRITEQLDNRFTEGDTWQI